MNCGRLSRRRDAGMIEAAMIEGMERTRRTSTRSRLVQCLTASILLAVAVPVRAANHRDWTVIPLGSFALQVGTQEIRVARPYDHAGVVRSPIVFVALYDPDRPQRAPVVIRFSAGRRKYPAWTVCQPGQMYVIGLAALEQGAGDDGRVLPLRVEVQGAPEKLALLASSGPDLALAGDDVLGPLEKVEQRLERGLIREYVHALNGSIGPTLKMAVGELERLAAAPDEQIARCAREKLRRIRFAEAELKVDLNFVSCYRVGLYAQQCGLFRSARRHFEEALRFESPGQPAWYRSDAWFRLGEVLERCGEPIEDVAQVMERAGSEARVQPNTWDVLVTVLLSEEYEEERDSRKRKVRVTVPPDHVERLKREWQCVQQMVYGASGGGLTLSTRFLDIPDQSAVPYARDAAGLCGPGDDLVRVRGSVDGVISIRPRGQGQAGGPDRGPNGAALSDVSTRCDWRDLLHAWRQQLDWVVYASELANGFPTAEYAATCGHQPIPSRGYGDRAALRYYLTPAMYRRLEPADPDPGAGYIRTWWVSDPREFHLDVPEGGTASPAQHFGPDDTRDWPRRLLRSNADFVDLRQFYVDTGSAIAGRTMTAATAYVESSRRQEVRLWLGHNDRMALWVNARLIHRGDYGATGQWEDRDRPNMVATAATLQSGWNRIDCTIESWRAPRDRGFGFSVRVCEFDNRPIDGLVVADAAAQVPDVVLPDALAEPRIGQLYKWDEVRDDYQQKLPRLTADVLGSYLAIRAPVRFVVGAQIGADGGYVALRSGAHEPGRTIGGVVIRAVPTKWDVTTDRDVRLNNVLDWSCEAVAVYPFQRRGEWCHLLFVRPEAAEAYLTCLREAPDADKLYGPRLLRDRVVGCLLVGDARGGDSTARVLIVAEAKLLLPLPADEEDLLSPVPQRG